MNFYTEEQIEKISEAQEEKFIDCADKEVYKYVLVLAKDRKMNWYLQGFVSANDVTHAIEKFKNVYGRWAGSWNKLEIRKGVDNSLLATHLGM